LKVARAELEDKMIRKALAATGGNRTHAANMLRDQPPLAVEQDEAIWYRIKAGVQDNQGSIALRYGSSQYTSNEYGFLEPWICNPCISNWLRNRQQMNLKAYNKARYSLAC
jgi:hypothetical protein